MDFSVNIEFDSETEIDEYLTILKRGIICTGFKLEKYKDKVTRKYKPAKHTTTFLGQNGVSITYYNKNRQLRDEKLVSEDILTEYAPTLRIEVCCKRKKINVLEKKYKADNIRDFLSASDIIGLDVFDRYVNMMFGSGDFYKLDEIKNKIKKSPLSKTKKDAMTVLAELSAEHSSLDKAVDRFTEKNKTKCKVEPLLNKFAELNIAGGDTRYMKMTFT
jgi:hypothetical protein